MPEKMNFETDDLMNKNVEKIAELFPAAVSEGKVNFDQLRTLLGDDLTGDEGYEFSWVGTREAMREAGRPTRKTLRPCPEESKDWETTENLYIEGDNLDVLKLLQESYLGKVKMIYIDPPYNTGNDFVYRDDFAVSRDEYDQDAGVIDEEGDRLFRNSESNGRFHSDWCSMMYPRLVLARNLLSDDGLIFISIDDNEESNLRSICDEIFGAMNFIATCVRKRRDSQANLSKNISPIHEYVLIYSRQMGDVLNKVAPTINDADYKNPDNDARGPYTTMPCTNVGGAKYSVTTPTGRVITDEWRFKRETYDRLFADDRIVFPRDGQGKPRYKLFLSEKIAEGVLANTWFDNVASNQEGSREIKAIFGSLLFDNPKPVGLLTRLLELGSKTESVILDFFSGSATTAHAVMQLNAEDDGKRKFIMVQLDEKTEENSEAYKAGYQNICEIGKERIRRAGEKIKEDLRQENKQFKLGEEPKQIPDIGFRMLKLDESNMKDVYYSAGEYSQTLLDQMTSNIKEGRTDLDLLYGCLLEWGLPLSLPHTQEEIEGVTVHTYNQGDLVACFAENVSESLVRQLANRQPSRVVFRDASFPNSSARINVEEIFKLLSPNTTLRVI